MPKRALRKTAIIVVTVISSWLSVTKVEAQSSHGPCLRGTGAGAPPATSPDPRSADGTAPGNGGSTGWSGGTGGSYIGTNPNGATPHTKTWQPPTVRGLDLKSTPAKDAAAC